MGCGSSSLPATQPEMERRSPSNPTDPIQETDENETAPSASVGTSSDTFDVAGA